MEEVVPTTLGAVCGTTTKDQKQYSHKAWQHVGASHQQIRGRSQYVRCSIVYVVSVAPRMVGTVTSMLGALCSTQGLAPSTYIFWVPSQRAACGCLHSSWLSSYQATTGADASRTVPGWSSMKDSGGVGCRHIAGMENGSKQMPFLPKLLMRSCQWCRCRSNQPYGRDTEHALCTV